MKITSLKINDINGIRGFELNNLDPKLNIICGENGIGKTSIIESITGCFTYSPHNQLKKRAGSESGIINIIFINNKNETGHIIYKISSFSPSEDSQGSYSSQAEEYAKYLLYFKTDRMFSHEMIHALNLNEDKFNHIYQNLSGVSKQKIKDWFIRYDLLLGKKYTSSEDEKNINLSKEIINALNQDYNFDSISGEMEICINTPTGNIPYEYLSSGFKSCIFIIWGIIREIQIRFPNTYARDFNGVIIIDEIELHLHPEWQNKIANILSSVFPYVQFIFTTHSPHVVQTAEHNQVIALTGSDGLISKKPLDDIAPNGFTGWSIEEILTDVMGMKSLRTEWFKTTLAKFEEALNNEDIENAKLIFNELENKLHPESTELALFRFQLSALAGEKDDFIK